MQYPELILPIMTLTLVIELLQLTSIKRARSISTIIIGSNINAGNDHIVNLIFYTLKINGLYGRKYSVQC